ncbi:MAG: glycoside hydrolase family 15 protein, partial [Sulfobacillus sp.]
GRPALPIQEDETALVLWALGRMFNRHHQVEVIRPHYRSFIIKAASFLAAHVDPATGLPLPSYDLWEERWGIHAYTIGATIAGLAAGASFAQAFGETQEADVFRQAGQKMAVAFYEHFWNDQVGRLARCGLTNPDGHLIELDMTADSALLGLSQFDEMDHPRLTATWQQIRQILSVQPCEGGIARYTNDQYQTALPNSAEIPGNPWFIATLWAARTLIREATDRASLDAAQSLVSWCASHALPSGIMAEQVHPETHEPLSVSPLTWSHSAFVSTVLALAAKGRKLAAESQ